ncbi:hypothetical protein C9J21_20655 [Photobacterium phosphoreum]|uniref:hypothetical protein n=1 Tax=Photobacterium phosphoreum TaxID=659 RepID=UPI000D16E57E|nr:hypothetical protein [Photobacterium phosphoreum]PSW28407.1 hypothetical protein C9J21_20655 [Photobacterium phosphoreum]
MHKNIKPRHKRGSEELILLSEWKTERIFTHRLKKFNTLNDFIEIVESKYGPTAALSFHDWHSMEDDFFNKKLIAHSEKLWLEDSHCPELINPTSDEVDLAVILPEPDIKQREKGNIFRISYYNKSGMRYHAVFKSFKEAVKETVMQGYSKVASGTLDSLVGTLDWNKGLVICKAVQSGVWINEYLERIATKEECALFNL